MHATWHWLQHNWQHVQNAAKLVVNFIVHHHARKP